MPFFPKGLDCLPLWHSLSIENIYRHSLTSSKSFLNTSFVEKADFLERYISVDYLKGHKRKVEWQSNFCSLKDLDVIALGKFLYSSSY